MTRTTRDPRRRPRCSRLAGCGGDDESSPAPAAARAAAAAGGGGQQLALSAPEDGSLKFDKTELEAKAGTVTINFDNQSSSTPHAVEIEGNGVEETSRHRHGRQDVGDRRPEARRVQVLLPGRQPRRSAGMEGTLTVQ